MNMRDQSLDYVRMMVFMHVRTFLNVYYPWKVAKVNLIVVQILSNINETKSSLKVYIVFLNIQTESNMHLATTTTQCQNKLRSNAFKHWQVKFIPEVHLVFLTIRTKSNMHLPIETTRRQKQIMSNVFEHLQVEFVPKGPF